MSADISAKDNQVAQTIKTITLAKAQSIQMTLQYCLETLEQACQCGSCDPCTNGQADIIRAIRSLDDIMNQGKAGR